MSAGFSKDVKNAKRLLADLPVDWDGKNSVLALKEANYNWRQMEWWAFYFEWLAFQQLGGVFEVPGDRINRVSFDLKGAVNWDLKAKAIKSDSHVAILNDKAAMDESVARYGEHGVMIGLCDVEYNDDDRSFQKWHSELKGGPSKYEKERVKRTSVSRYRKTHANLTEVLFLRFDKDSLASLSIHKQGRNSNGRARPTKYCVDVERLDGLLVDRLEFLPRT